MSNKNVLKTIDEELKKVAKSLEKKGKGKKTDPELDPKTILSIFNSFLVSMTEITKIIQKEESSCTEVKDIKKSTRVLEDQADDQEQRNMQGKLILCSRPNDANESCIQSKEELDQQGCSVKQHVVLLTKEKLGVDVKESDILRTYYFPNGNLSVQFDPIMTDDSALTKVVTAIKSPTQHNKQMNLFFNFQLTRRRSQLLWEVRKLKKSGKIARYWTDSDGSITIRQKEGEGEGGHKEKVTSFRKGKSFNSNLITITATELIDKYK
jgi:hypothetical protein